MLSLKLVNDKNITSRNVLCISAPEDGESLPQKTVIVIDYSGSMSSDATPDLPESERDGISILMLIIHCIKVMVRCLGPKDSVAIVCFNENAKLYFPMNKMTDFKKWVVVVWDFCFGRYLFEETRFVSSLVDVCDDRFFLRDCTAHRYAFEQSNTCHETSNQRH